MKIISSENGFLVHNDDPSFSYSTKDEKIAKIILEEGELILQRHLCRSVQIQLLRVLRQRAQILNYEEQLIKLEIIATQFGGRISFDPRWDECPEIECDVKKLVELDSLRKALKGLNYVETSADISQPQYNKWGKAYKHPSGTALKIFNTFSPTTVCKYVKVGTKEVDVFEFKCGEQES